ncbi:MAG: hypothetical protein Q4B43_03140 [Bacteroidota bacterium]|nr:hypothetical protein [Bacteroidota bacterium]
MYKVPIKVQKIFEYGSVYLRGNQADAMAKRTLLAVEDWSQEYLIPMLKNI